MKDALFSSIVKYFVEDMDFVPAANNGEHLAFDTGINILVKNSYSSKTFLAFIDADKFSPEEIKADLQICYDRLIVSSSENVDSKVVFFFQNTPEPEKLSIINDNEFKRNMASKSINCISVDLSINKVTNHSKAFFSDKGIVKMIERFLLSDERRRPVTSEEISEILLKKQKSYEFEVKSEVPRVTFILIIINVLIFGAMKLYESSSGIDFSRLLVDFGAKENLLIIKGEYWRFVTPIFLHANLVHLLVNCYSLYAVGIFVEKIFGHFRFTLVYFIAGIIGNIASFACLASPGVGASGAIFGLLGAMLYFGIEKPALFKNYFGSSIVTIIIANLAYGFSNSGIDNFAHIGGLIGGFLASGAVYSSSKQNKSYLTKVMWLLITLVVASGLIFYGFNSNLNKILSKVAVLESYEKEEEWADVENLGENIMMLEPSNENVKLEVLWSIVRAETIQKKFDEGIRHASEVELISPKDGHYLSGILYLNMGKYDQAKTELLAAKKLNAEYENIDKILNELEEVTR